MLGTGMIVAGFPLAFSFSIKARGQSDRRTLGTVALGVTILALVAAVAVLFVVSI